MTHTFLVDENGEFHRIDDPPKISDMVCVVRCKDCKHWWYGNYCDKHGKGQENADWFCADGVMKDDG